VAIKLPVYNDGDESKVQEQVPSVQDVQDAIDHLGTGINTVTTSLNTEITARMGADASLTGQLNAIGNRVATLENLGSYVGSFDTYANLPTNISHWNNTGITINDFVTVRADETKNGAATRYVATQINTTTGVITWTYDLTYSTDVSGKIDNTFTTNNIVETVDKFTDNYTAPVKGTNTGFLNMFINRINGLITAVSGKAPVPVVTELTGRNLLHPTLGVEDSVVVADMSLPVGKIVRCVGTYLYNPDARILAEVLITRAYENPDVFLMYSHHNVQLVTENSFNFYRVRDVSGLDRWCFAFDAVNKTVITWYASNQGMRYISVEGFIPRNTIGAVIPTASHSIGLIVRSTFRSTTYNFVSSVKFAVKPSNDFLFGSYWGIGYGEETDSGAYGTMCALPRLVTRMDLSNSPMEVEVYINKPNRVYDLNFTTDFYLDYMDNHTIDYFYTRVATTSLTFTNSYAKVTINSGTIPANKYLRFIFDQGTFYNGGGCDAGNVVTVSVTI